MNSGVCGSSGVRHSGCDEIHLSLASFQARLTSTISQAFISQDPAWVVSLTILERAGLSLEMGRVPRGQISYKF